MKRISTLFTAGLLTFALSTPVLAGPVGVSRSYPVAQPNMQTIADLQQAAEAAQREARDGNKNNPAFGQKSYQIEQVVARIENGQQVDQQQVDEALQPVRVW